MILKDVIHQLGLEILVESPRLEERVRGGYTSDLLSDVIGRAREGELWITLQTHQNIVAVAKLKEIAGIIIVGGRRPEPETLEKAGKENVAILRTDDPAYIISGRLFSLLDKDREAD